MIERVQQATGLIAADTAYERGDHRLFTNFHHNPTVRKRITGVQQFAGHTSIQTTGFYDDRRTNQSGKMAILLEEWD